MEEHSGEKYYLQIVIMTVIIRVVWHTLRKQIIIIISGCPQ